MNNCNCTCHKMTSHNFECVQLMNKQIKKTRSKKNLKCICNSKKTFKICSDCYMNHPNSKLYSTAKFGSQLIERL